MGWQTGMGWSVGSWLGMGLGMGVFWALLLVAVVALVRGSMVDRRRFSDHRGSHMDEHTRRDIVQGR